MLSATTFAVPTLRSAKFAAAVAVLMVTVSPAIRPVKVRLLLAMVAVVLPSYTLLSAVKLPAMVNSFGVMFAVAVGAPVRVIA